MFCRLCTKTNGKAYHFFDSEGLKMKIVSIVAKHFWFEPKPEDNTSHLICGSCWIITKNFHELYLLAKKVEKTFPLIKENSYIDLEFNDFGYHSYDVFPKNSGNNQNIEKKSNIKINQTTYSLQLEPIVETNKDSLEDKLDKAITKKHQHLPSTKISGTIIRKSKRTSKNNDADYSVIDYELNNSISETKKKDETKLVKRTPEETAEFNKKVAEGDALIAKFMKIVCDFCSEEQKNFTSFKHHSKSVHGKEGVITCCDKKFLKKCKLVEHVGIHLDPEKYKCHTCGDVLKGKRHLQLHSQNKHEECIKLYNCSHCGKSFRNNSLRMRHELIHVPEEEKKFKCVHCAKNFPAEQNLKLHIRFVHDEHYASICDICGKTYNNRGELKQHRLKIHEGIKTKLKCKYCDKEFATRYSYDLHKFSEHENTNSDMELKCPTCDKTLKNPKVLKNHIHFVHKAKAKFKCNLCNKAFRLELALKEHMAAHSGQPLYSCPHCPRTFTHNSNMHHHRKLKHPAEFQFARQKKDKKETWKQITGLDLV